MSLMGVVMMVGIVVSNSILIVEFARSRLREQGTPLQEAVAVACRMRLRPVLMTSLATIIGLIPMALKLGTGAEAYAPLARAIIGGLAGFGRGHGLSGSGRLPLGAPQGSGRRSGADGMKCLRLALFILATLPCMAQSTLNLQIPSAASGSSLGPSQDVQTAPSPSSQTQQGAGATHRGRLRRNGFR